MKIIKPKRLAKGQTVGFVAPSSPCNEDRQIHFAINTMKSFGFLVKEGEHLYDRHGYLAGTDRDRAADVNAMFADDEVDAIITLRGGYGAARILPYLDYNLIRKRPKVITGFSDVTALLTAIHVKTGLVTFMALTPKWRIRPTPGQNSRKCSSSQRRRQRSDPRRPSRSAKAGSSTPTGWNASCRAK